MTEAKTKLICSFCGQSEDQGVMLIAGPNIYICDECIAICNEIISGKGDSAQAKRERVRLRAISELKKILRRGTTVYTLSGGDPRILAVKSRRIVDVTDLICDVFRTAHPNRCNFADLGELLFGSRRGLRRVRL